MYLNRTAEKVIKQIHKHFKVLLVTGARQVGKSTLLKKCSPDMAYVTLDNPNIRELAINEPQLFLERYTPPLIIDEIQYAPNLLQYIKMVTDESNSKGQYWLTGSQQFNMMKNVSESLAGRVGIVNLMGFSLNELRAKPYYNPFLPDKNELIEKRKTSKAYNLKDIYEIIWRGSYPQINTDTGVDWEIFYSSYVQTYIERDIKDLNAVSNEMTFLKFIKVIAARTGQVINYSEVANEVGISQPTAKSWLSVLVSSNIVFLLEPYFNNINKRIIKSPKVYFLDTGLCAYLTGWSNSGVLEEGAMSGSFFETFVMSEIIKSYKHNGKNPPIYYYRDKDKKEIDAIIEKDGKLYPVEIKKTSNPDKAAIKNFSVIPKDRLGHGVVVCLSKEDYPLSADVDVIPIGYI